MFKLGDRVITTNKVSSSIDVGFTGTIVDEGELVVSVEFDRKIENGHSCSGKCEYGYGWNVLTKDLRHLGRKEEYELTIDDKFKPEEEEEEEEEEEVYYQDTPYKDGKIVVDELYDSVERPAHYNQYRIEVIEIIEDATKNLKGMEAVCTANALKYLLRFQYKDGKKDVRKAIWYLKRLLENMKEGE